MSSYPVVEFRPSPVPAMYGALFQATIIYFLFKTLGDETAVPAWFAAYPFGIITLLSGCFAASSHRSKVRENRIRVDETGITYNFNKRILFKDVSEIKFAIHTVGDIKFRSATITPQKGTSFRFGALPISDLRWEGIQNIEDAGLLLSLITAGTKSKPLYPAAWTNYDETVEESSAPVKKKSFASNFKAAYGLIPVLFKILPKVATVALKLVKTLKPAGAVAALGIYSVVFSWKFAFGLVGMILLHECGHVYAMWRCGLKVKGIYFIPFFGGVAMSDGLAPTRLQNAYIAINGPVWGTALAVACLVVYFLSAGNWPTFAGLAAWGALINLFNLLPILPLDGGRILSDLAHSRGSRWGATAVAASLLFGGVVGYLNGLQLLVLMVIIGAGEFGHQLDAARLGAVASSLGKRRKVSFEESEHFHSFVAAVETGRTTGAETQTRKIRFEEMEKEARQVPMSIWEGKFILGGYGGLVVILGSLLYFIRNIPGAGEAIDFLR